MFPRSAWLLHGRERLFKESKMKTKSNGEARPVLVTTEYKGVFFGYAEDTSGETIQLQRARNCIYWPVENRGFMGLASDGPKKGAKVGPRADIELRKVTSIVEVSPEAVKAWEAIEWSM